MNKTLRWAKWGMIPLSVAAVAAVVIANPFAQTAPVHSFSIMSPSQARDLKAQLRAGHVDADAIKRPTANREASPSSADDQFFQERAYPAADVPAAGYTNGFSQYNLINQDGGASLQWKQLGPLSTPDGSTWGPAGAGTVSGRATAIVADPATCSNGACQTIYLGTANGGVWKTTNGGKNWTPLTEHQSTLAIGSLTLDPHNPNIIYAGTGEPNNSIDSNHGQGILKSTNGGLSWTTLGFNNFVNRSVADIVVDPRDGNLYAISYLARSGGAGTTYGSSLDNPYLPPVGFYRSTDGGQTWTMSNPTSSFFTDYTGRTGPNSLVRASDGALYLGVYGQGIYTSSNGGQSWSALPNAAETKFDRITLAVAPSNPAVVYAAYSHDIDGSGGMTFYSSANRGASWNAQPNTPSACEGQCWYDMPVAVSSTDPSTVYVGGMFNYGGCAPAYPYPASCNTVIMKSTDGGATWRDIGYNSTGVNVHPDDHAILPTAQGGLYTANDGGLYHSADNGGTWESLNNALGTLQFQSVAVNSNGDVFGGTQDNGTWKIATGSTNGAHIMGGDGGMTAADPSNPNIAFDEYYGSQLQRYDASSTVKQTWMAGWWCDYFCFGGGLFYEPVALGNKTPTGASASNDVFSGTYRLWRSEMGGGIDANHDGDATNDSGDTTDFVPITPNVGSISVIAVSPVNPNVVAIATSAGHIYYTTNALAPVQLANTCATHTDPQKDLIAAYCQAAGVDPTWSGEKVCSQPWTNAYDTSSFCDYVSGVSWTRLDVNTSGASVLPGRWVSSMTFAPGSTTLLATFSGFDENTPGASGHVFVTANAGAASGTVWRNISGTGHTAIPDVPANGVVVAPHGTIYVAADFGVFVTRDGGQTWLRTDASLPDAPVYDLALSPDGHALYAATHGRGIWSASVHGA